MKTSAILPFVLVSLSSIACAPAEEPAEEEALGTTEDAVSGEAQRPVREALFAEDTNNEIWFVCKSGSGRTATTFVITSAAGSTYQVSATYQKASFYTGYVTSHVRLGKATLSGTYPQRIFTFSIDRKVARIQAPSFGDGPKPSLTFGGKTLSLRCDEYDAPYALDSVFG